MVTFLRLSLRLSRFVAFALLSFSPCVLPWNLSLAIASDSSEHFKVDQRLQANVDFWIQVYSKYTSSQGIIHDSKYIGKIYQIVEKPTSRSVRAIKKEIKNTLLSVHKKQSTGEALTDEEMKVFKLFEDVNEPNKFQAAAHRKRLRYQLGQKDLFLEGLKVSGRYLSHMEQVFKDQGLPVELTRLPFVESSFNIKARSKVGASGIWQFMRSTGRLYLKINSAVDERNDPFLATEAAARLLRLNYESLGRWSLAVTAYNHGRKGMMRAVRKVGSEALEDLVDSYKSRSFGFASSNFFSGLVAAIEVEKNAEKYFGKVERDPPLQFVEIKLPQSVSMKSLTNYLKLDKKEIAELNPALSSAVLSGRAAIPKNYRLKLKPVQDLSAEAQVRLFLDGLNQIHGAFKGRSSSGDKL